MKAMEQYEYSQEYLSCIWEYQEYLAVRGMCRLMIALHQQDYDVAADVWNKHEGPHYNLTRHAISALISYLVHNGKDPSEWALGYKEWAGSDDLVARDMCRIMIALSQEDYDAALDTWNNHEGRDLQIAMKATTLLTLHYERDGQDPIEWARGYEGFAAKQVESAEINAVRWKRNLGPS
jgi:hypothetical protein